MTETADWTKAEKIAEGFVASWGACEPGGAVVGFDADGLRFAKAGGLESLNNKVPFSAKSVVRFASVTKHVFCTLVLQHPDLITLDDRLGDHLPELREPLASVTVGRALDMSAGLPDVRECLTLLGLSVFTETQAEPLLDFTARMTRLNYDYGTEISYSNTGYRLVEAALERKGIFLRSYVRDELNPAFGLGFDAPDVWNDPVDELVTGYWNTGEKWQQSVAGLHISASGSLTGSAENMADWLRALVAGEGPLKGLLETMTAPRKLVDETETDYGLGIRKVHLGAHTFVGHGGSHPGFKAHFLVDPQTSCGVVVVSNSEDTNAYKIALETLAALTGEALPVATSTRLPDGLYVTEEGANWLEIKGSTSVWLDADDTLYEAEDGTVSSRSASSPLRLRAEGKTLVGEIGHVARRLVPAQTDLSVPKALDGTWVSSEGAHFMIAGGNVIMGVGPIRNTMPLTPLGKGLYLFTLKDGPWTKRICLHLRSDNQLDLILSRARMMEYRRV